MSAPSPLLDFFKRGEVARDVRLLAARGVLAPRAHEQLAILVVLVDDADPEIRTTAAATIDRIPGEALRSFLARDDMPSGLREFFAARGIVSAEGVARQSDDPLIEELAEAGPEADALDDEPAAREGLAQRIAQMSFPDRVKAAMKGSREIRALLIRDPNKMVSAAVLSSPQVSEQEIETFSRMPNITEDILRVIASNRAWTKNYGIVVGLTKNPKTPVALSLHLMARLSSRDLSLLSMDRNVPEPLRVAARRRVAAGSSGS